MMVRKRMNEVVDAIKIVRNVIDDQTALKAKVLYPTWEDLVATGYTAVAPGCRFCYGDNLYKTRLEDFTFTSRQVPGENSDDLYTKIEAA